MEKSSFFLLDYIRFSLKVYFVMSPSILHKNKYDYMDLKSSLTENSQVRRKKPLKKKTVHRHRQQYDGHQKEEWGET